MATQPVRCFSCGKVTKFELYYEKIDKGVNKHKVLDQMKAKICCRRTYLSHNRELDKRLELYSDVEEK